VDWLIYRGVAYDATAFIKHHPAGAWLVRLGVGRDATALFESYHLRPEVAAARLARLPTLAGFPVHAVPPSPRPSDSPLYATLRDRVRAELFAGADGAAAGAHRRGSDGAAVAVVSAAVAAYALFATAPSALTGALLGLAGAWIGLTVQHCGNHGAMSVSPAVNQILGFGDDLIGGSSLAWQYHHQVSHHIHCNDHIGVGGSARYAVGADAEGDEDVFSSFPLLRFDPRQPRAWYHAHQHVYMWALFPFMQLAFQVGDWQAIVSGKTAGTTMHGATVGQRLLAAAGKLTHYALLLAVPYYTAGTAAALAGAAAFTAVQGVVLAATFAVSHNVPEAKPALDGTDSTPAHGELVTGLMERDWGVQQVRGGGEGERGCARARQRAPIRSHPPFLSSQVTTSANYGGAVANFMTGGLSLQVEHHLFPAISFMHYPAIAAIVEDECVKRGIAYARYSSLVPILGRFVGYMRDVGRVDQTA